MCCWVSFISIPLKFQILKIFPVRKVKSLLVIFGATDQLNPRQEGQVRHTVSNISDEVIIHPLYNASTNINNVALIRLSQKLVFSDYIQPVKLPSNELFNTFTNSPVIVSGWGSIDDDEEIVPYLQYGYGSVLDLNQCISSYGPELINQGNICLKNNQTGGASSCNGDTGGPCVSTVTGELIGISSFVPVSGCEVSPSVYSRVTYFRDWIKKETGI